MRHSGIGPPSRTGSALIRKSRTNVTKADTSSMGSGDEGGQVFINTAHYKGAVVAVKPVMKQKIKMDRSLLVEMRHVSSMFTRLVMWSRDSHPR